MVFREQDMDELKHAVRMDKKVREIATKVANERIYQDKKWGTIEEHPHDVGAWLLIMQKELNEAVDAWCSDRGDRGALEEVLQVVAVGFAAMEQHGVYEPHRE